MRLTVILTTVFLCAATNHLAASPDLSYEAIEDEARVPILTPSFADRKTAKIQLSNGLQAYIISDPRAEKSAAALVVEVGSWEEPEDSPGMAHFVEHMLFLGTKTYPDESSFDLYVSQRGGQSNAYTGGDQTAYMFSVNTDGFPEALDRFSDFFVEPLFNVSGLDREVNAVDQEFLRATRDDAYRREFIRNALGNPKHPDSRFTMGNKQTLARIPREKLIQWYQEHYSANLMHLVVYSSVELETLKDLVAKDFSRIPNLSRKPFATTEPLLGVNQRGAITWIASLKDAKTLALSWELPGRFVNTLETKPGQLVCYVLGHEGDNSLLAILKEHGLAESLTCGSGRLGPNNYLLTVEIGLTKKGIKDYESVIEAVFQAIDKMRGREYPSYLFDEAQKIALVKYQYQERQDAYEVVSNLIGSITKEGLATFPEQNHLFTKFDPKLVAEFLNYLTPQNVYITLLAQPVQLKMELDRVEPWSGTAYTGKALSPESIAKWKNLEPSARLDVPGTNPYLPSNLQVLAKENPDAQAMPRPKLLVNNVFDKLYYAQDDYYRVPEVYCFFDIMTPSVNQGDPKKAALIDLYVKAAHEILKRSLYPADQAGLYFEISPDMYGISLSLYGYDEHAAKLLGQVLDKLTRLQPTAEQFGQYRETLMKEYHNFEAESPVIRSSETLSAVLNKDYSTNRQKYQAMQRINYEQFLAFSHELFAKNYVKGILYGNLTEEQALEMASVLRKGLGGGEYPLKDRPVKEVADLSSQSAPHFLVEKSKTTGNAIIMVLESGPYSQKLQAIQSILSQGLNGPFYSTLRTQQQTGYVVQNWNQELQRHLFQFFAVESDTHDGRDLLSRFELFFEDFNRNLGTDELTQPEFASIQAALLNRLEKPAQNLHAMGQILAVLATNYDGDFDWINKRIAAMRDLTYAEFLEDSKKILSTQNKKRLAVIMKGAQAAPTVLDYRASKGLKEMRNSLDYEPAGRVAQDK